MRLATRREPALTSLGGEADHGGVVLELLGGRVEHGSVNLADGVGRRAVLGKEGGLRDLVVVEAGSSVSVGDHAVGADDQHLSGLHLATDGRRQ